MVQLTLLRWLVPGRGCKGGREKVWIYRIVLPNEESAKIMEQVDGNVKAVRVIDDKVYSMWKKLRFEFYIDMKKIGIPVVRGLRLVHDEYRGEVEAYLRGVKKRLEEIEHEIWKRMPADLAQKLRGRESLHPARNFRWVAIPIEICRENYQELLAALRSVEETRIG
jgi:hypothetical protein